MGKASFITWVSCIFSLFSTDVWGTSLSAETYFSGEQLKAYRLAQKGKTELVVEATKAGVDLNRPGKEDLTMLGLAVINADRQAIISLMRAGADPNRIIPDAGSPAVLAITRHFNPPRTEAVAALLAGGYDPNQLLVHGTPYLFYFVDYNHWPGLKLALERGGDINVKRNNGKTLLMYLLEHGNFTQAGELISKGADVAQRTYRDETALGIIERKIHNIRSIRPEMRSAWKEVLGIRNLILSKLPEQRDRRTMFTDAAEAKIREISASGVP